MKKFLTTMMLIIVASSYGFSQKTILVSKEQADMILTCEVISEQDEDCAFTVMWGNRAYKVKDAPCGVVKIGNTVRLNDSIASTRKIRWSDVSHVNKQ